MPVAQESHLGGGDWNKRGKSVLCESTMKGKVRSNLSFQASYFWGDLKCVPFDVVGDCGRTWLSKRQPNTWLNSIFSLFISEKRKNKDEDLVWLVVHCLTSSGGWRGPSSKGGKGFKRLSKWMIRFAMSTPRQTNDFLLPQQPNLDEEKVLHS